MSFTFRKEKEKPLTRCAFHYDPNRKYFEEVEIGEMNTVCASCGALKWKTENSGMCCDNGKVVLEKLCPPINPLKDLMSGNSTRSKHFLENIRKYNSCFQMTSFGCTKEIREKGFMPTFKVQGQIYHRIGSLMPVGGEDPKFFQVYFISGAEKQNFMKEADQRCNNIDRVHKDIVLELQEFFHVNNHYVNLFKSGLNLMSSDNMRLLIRADKAPHGEHERRYNAPSADEVAVVLVGNEYDKRDIILHKQNNKLDRISETHRSYDALQYPIIFWQGEDGYNFCIHKRNPETGEICETKKVSSREFYAYRIMVRDKDSNHILQCQQLFHQYVVDMYAKIEGERLRYIRMNQQKLRADQYIHLRDAVNNDINASNVGKMVILPATFTGSPRHMHEYTQDAMTYV
jgi:hypothetical protein